MKTFSDEQIAKGMRETAQLHPCDKPGQMHAWWRSADLVVMLWTERASSGAWHLSASSCAAALSQHDQESRFARCSVCHSGSSPRPTR